MLLNNLKFWFVLTVELLISIPHAKILIWVCVGNFQFNLFYREKRIKTIIDVDEEKDTIRYKPKILYFFRPDLSNGLETDRLVAINVPFVVSRI